VISTGVADVLTRNHPQASATTRNHPQLF